MQIENVAITSLVEDPSNARKHDPKNLDAIKGSLAKFGQQKPIVVGKGNVVLAGNGTLSAAKALGWDKINIVRTELEGSEAIAYAIADNRTGELAAWNDDVLSRTLQGLKDDGIDLGAIGFDDEDLAQWLKTPEVVPGCDEDEVPEVTDTRCKPGDLWQLGNHRLLCGDSTNVQHVERLMGGEKAQTFFSDPPYGDNVGGLRTKTAAERVPGKGLIKRSSFIANDKEIDWLVEVFNLVPTFLTEKATKMVFFKWDKYVEILEMAEAFGKPSALCVWDRVRRANNFFRFQPQHELCLHWGNQEDKKESISLANVWHEPKELENKELHPTVKPIAILEPVVRVTTDRNAIVLDLFLGSGSTLIACEKTNRRCFGMEIDPGYCDVILARWEKFTGKTAVLLTGEKQDA